MNEIKDLQQKIVDFRNKRDWKQFHNLKDLAIDLSVESTELLEVFQWLSKEEVENILKDSKKKAKIEEELADVFWSTLLFAHDARIDLKDALDKKIGINHVRYPVEKSKGSHKKHTEYI